LKSLIALPKAPLVVTDDTAAIWLEPPGAAAVLAAGVPPKKELNIPPVLFVGELLDVEPATVLDEVDEGVSNRLNPAAELFVPQKLALAASWLF